MAILTSATPAKDWATFMQCLHDTKRLRKSLQPRLAPYVRLYQMKKGLP